MHSEKYSFIGEAIYEKRFGSNLLKGGWKQSNSLTRLRYEQPAIDQARLPQSESFLYAEWSGEAERWSYNVALGGNRFHYKADDSAHTFYNFLPRWMFAWRPDNNSLIRYDGELTATNPGIQELSAAEVRIDSVLYERGNPELRSYRNVTNNLYAEWSRRKTTLTLSLSHHYRHRPIMPARFEEGGRFVSMPFNMKRWHKLNAEIGGKISLLGDALQLSVAGGANRYESVGRDYSHTYSNLYYSINLVAMYRRWMAIGMIRSADKELVGETVHSANNYHYLSLQYNAKRFSLGAGAFNPFGFVSESIWENRNSRAPFRKKIIGKDSQMFVLTFTWSFGFGKPYSEQGRRLENVDNDAGLRKEYR